MPNYLNGKLYRIICLNTGLQFIGSTTINLAARLAQHKKLYKDGDGGISKLVFEIGAVKIVLIEDYPCDRKEQLAARERHFIETLDCVNKTVLLRSPKDWYQNNKERLIKNQTVWNNNNKEKLRVYQNRFRQKNIPVQLDEEMMTENEPIELKLEELYEFKL